MSQYFIQDGKTITIPAPTYDVSLRVEIWLGFTSPIRADLFHPGHL